MTTDGCPFCQKTSKKTGATDMGHVFGQRVGLVNVYTCPDGHQWNDAHKILGACATKFRDGTGKEWICEELSKHHQHHANLSLEQVRKLSPPDYRTWVIVALGATFTASTLGHDAMLIDPATGDPSAILMVRQGTVGESTVAQMIDILRKLADLEFKDATIVGFDMSEGARTRAATTTEFKISLLPVSDIIARLNSVGRSTDPRHFSIAGNCYENDADAKANGTYPQWLEDINRRKKVMRRRIYVG